jgi:stage II sporulation protein D
MLKKLTLLLLFALTAHANDPSKKNKPATVRVLLTKLADEALIEVKGRHLIYNPKNDQLIASNSKKKKAKVATRDTGIYWGESFPQIFEMRIVPNEESTRILVNGVQYKGCIEVYSIGGTINIVNEVDTENYLQSTLSSQISQKLSREALDAIVITSRTHLLYLIQKDSYASWQVEAEKEGYQGLVSARQNPQVAAAVNRTRDLVLHYKKKPFATSWSEDCGGRTVSYQSIYRKNSLSTAGVDNLPSLRRRDKGRWRATVPIQTLAKTVGLSNIREVDLFRADQSKKIYAVRFVGPEGKKDISFFALQKALGKSTLKSNDFKIVLRNNKAHFLGYGKGVGVGLCALSAEILAQRKATTKSILTTHFPGCELLNLREETGESPNRSFIWN